MPSNSNFYNETPRQSEIRQSVQSAITDTDREAVAIPLLHDVEEARYALAVAISEGRTQARRAAAADRTTTIPVGIPMTVQPMTRDEMIAETQRRC